MSFADFMRDCDPPRFEIGGTSRLSAEHVEILQRRITRSLYGLGVVYPLPGDFRPVKSVSRCCKNCGAHLNSRVCEYCDAVER